MDSDSSEHLTENWTIIFPGPPRVLPLGWSELSPLIGHTFLSAHAVAVLSRRGGACAAIINLQLYFCGSEEQVAPYKYSLQSGKQNEHRQPKEESPATAPWSHWEGCCSKLFEYLAGAPSPWSSGWRGGLKAHRSVLRGPSGRQWRLWTTCQDHRWRASSGTCSPSEGCHDCTSYR